MNKKQAEFKRTLLNSPEIQKVLDYLLSRWEDENENEDIKAYGVIFQKLVAKRAGINRVIKTESRRPGMISFMVEPIEKGIGVVEIIVKTVDNKTMDIEVCFKNWFVHDGIVTEEQQQVEEKLDELDCGIKIMSDNENEEKEGNNEQQQ